MGIGLVASHAGQNLVEKVMVSVKILTEREREREREKEKERMTIKIWYQMV